MQRAADGVGGFKAVRRSDEDELAHIDHCRSLQRKLFDGGFAGICVPRAYGGQGLTAAHQAAFNREIRGYEYPADTQVPTFTPCMSVILEFGTEEQKVRHIPPILKGETFWMQFLSEPSGGSDLAGAQTTAVRDGDEWVLNGSKIWTTGAWWADWALCLARTNWDVPKHRGLSVFMVEIHQPGIEIHRIEMLNGSREFCQEFMTDLRVPDAQRIGPVDEGWGVAVRWMYHERTIAGGSPYVTAPAGQPAVALDPTGGPPALLPSLTRRGLGEDARVREQIGESLAIALVGDALTEPHRRADPQRCRLRPGGRHHPPVVRHGRRAQFDDRLRPRRARRGGLVGRGTGAGPDRRPVPDAPDVVHRRRHHRDGAQRHQRTGARHATRNGGWTWTSPSATSPAARRRTGARAASAHCVQR